MSVINAPAGAVVLIQQSGPNVQYSTNNGGSWTTIIWPCSINNSTPEPYEPLYVQFNTDITLTAPDQFFACTSDFIQIGNQQLNNDGTRTLITIDSVSNYPGLIRNGTYNTPGKGSIFIYNLEVNGTTSTLQYDVSLGAGGWIAQAYYGNGVQDQPNIITNCVSNGPIVQYGGGICGSYAHNNTNIPLYIRGCSSSGDIASYAGGIVGANAGNSSGRVTVNRCSSTGNQIGSGAGGLVGDSCSGMVTISSSYSTGVINFGGGIIGGGNVGGSGQTININLCYSSGSMTNGGGICYDNATNVYIYNCYSSGSIDTNSGGIFQSLTGGAPQQLLNCYTCGISAAGLTNGIVGGSSSDSPDTYSEANNGNSGSWTDSNAINVLQSYPVTSGYGIYWSQPYGPNTPYVLTLSAYTPYSLTLPYYAVAQPEQVYGSVAPGNTTPPAVVPGFTYQIIDINEVQPVAFPFITIDQDTGAISVGGSSPPGIYTIQIFSTKNPYSVTTYFLAVILPPSNIGGRAYWPTNTDRIDLIKATPCPCDPAAAPISTNGQLVQQLRFRQSCCTKYVSGDAISYDELTPNAYYRLNGGVCKGKPTLFQATGSNTLTVIEQGIYEVPPPSNYATVTGPDGYSYFVTFAPSLEVCPCPSYNPVEQRVYNAAALCGSGVAAPVFNTKERTLTPRELLNRKPSACCPFTATSASLSGGSGYVAGNYFTVAGGTPTDKPILMQVTEAGVSIVGGNNYSVKPTNMSTVWLSGSGSGGTVTITWSMPPPICCNK